MTKVRYNLRCESCNSTNSFGVIESSKLKWCPICQKNSMHYPNDSYIISDDELVAKVHQMIEEKEKENGTR